MMRDKIFCRAMLSATAAPLALGLALAAASPASAQTQDTGGAAPAPAAPGTNTTSPSTAPLGQTPTAPATPGAPPPAASEQGEIIVTGTLFRNPAAASASPLVTLSAADLTARGINTVADAVQKLSSNNAGTLATNWSAFGFSTGASAPSLRGLNDAYTLTVFDNLRSAPYPLADDTRRNFVDINTIPDSVVDHIDVLQDGASSAYGSDAIAGVVNVIIKKQITGLHLNASGGVSTHGDGGEQRLDATYGYGDLASDGFNVWVNGEYQHNDPIYLRDRGFPYGTADLSSICGTANGLNPDYPAGTKVCMNNGVVNGVQPDGSFTLGTTQVPIVRPYDASGSPVTGSQWQFLNPGAGCGNLTAYTLTSAQRTANPAAPAVVCQEDRVNKFYQYSPDITRYGANARATVNIGSQAQAYAMFNFYEVKTINTGTDENLAGQTAAGGQQVTLSPLLLPAYICPRGTVTCTAANGTLNPNNPFAAQGLQAGLRQRYDRPETTLTDAKTFRFSGGVSGTFGDGWNYNADATYSRVKFRLIQKNFINAQHLLDVIADGSFNFANPAANSASVRDYLSPPNISHDHSSLLQVQATLSKSFFELPGGQLQVLVGGSYRKEKIYEPSANPPNAVNPTDRYYRVNAVEVIGGRSVKSGFFEVDAPVLTQVDLKVQGRYDDYSTGQTNFSPKFEATFQPIHQVKFRGTFSKGFRVPSLAEAFGAPATGYVTTQLDPTDPAQAAFIAAHGGNTYATQAYSYGLTGSGNASLKPEKATQWTAGVVLQPTNYLTLTADYYHVKIKGVINPPDCSAAVAQYYQNNGTTNIPGCTTTAGVPDPEFPNAQALLGDVAYSYVNADAFKTSGIDVSATLRVPLGNGMRWTSSGTATYIKNLSLIQNGQTFRFDGTLSPCNITSCSGTPKWRASWENTLEVGKASVTATAYYTSGYSLISVDPPYTGVRGDCAGSIGNSVVAYEDGTTPVRCHARHFIDVDLTANYKLSDKFTIYMNVLNVLGTKPPFDPSAGYSIYQFNPAWADQGFIGRYFRVGAKVDF